MTTQDPEPPLEPWASWSRGRDYPWTSPPAELRAMPARRRRRLEAAAIALALVGLALAVAFAVAIRFGG